MFTKAMCDAACKSSRSRSQEVARQAVPLRGANVVARDNDTVCLVVLKRTLACCLSVVVVETDRQYTCFWSGKEKHGQVGEKQYESLCI